MRASFHSLEPPRLPRRTFLARAALATAATGLLSSCAIRPRSETELEVMTVLGSIRARDLGPTLPHEHIFLDFEGVTAAGDGTVDWDAVAAVALPHLQLLKDLGCQSLVECTPAYLGREPLLLKRLAEESGLHLLTNTGYYGARDNRYLPRHAWTETADELAARWLMEWRDGIGTTEVRPGFIKLGVESGPLSDLHRKLVRAAARAHLASGLTIAVHTGNGEAAMDEMAVLREEGVSPAAWIWVHAQNESDTTVHLRAAELGAWVEFDGVSHSTVGRHVDLVKLMRAHGLLRRVLVSHDAGWYEAGKPHGGEYRPYDVLFKGLLPALKDAGVSDAEIHQLLVVNPREAFAIQIRSAKATGILRPHP